MQKLIDGIHQFQIESFLPLQGLFELLANSILKKASGTSRQTVFARIYAVGLGARPLFQRTAKGQHSETLFKAGQND